MKYPRAERGKAQNSEKMIASGSVPVWQNALPIVPVSAGVQAGREERKSGRNPEHVSCHQPVASKAPITSVILLSLPVSA
jgi:hypothetical protein